MTTNDENTNRVMIIDHFESLNISHLRFFSAAAKLGNVYLRLRAHESHHRDANKTEADAEADAEAEAATASENARTLAVLSAIRFISNVELAADHISDDLDIVQPDILYCNCNHNHNHNDNNSDNAGADANSNPNCNNTTTTHNNNENIDFNAQAEQSAILSFDAQIQCEQRSIEYVVSAIHYHNTNNGSRGREHGRDSDSHQEGGADDEAGDPAANAEDAEDAEDEEEEIAAETAVTSAEAAEADDAEGSAGAHTTIPSVLDALLDADADADPDADDPGTTWKKQFPWRLCFAGAWLDQPWVSRQFPGSCIVINVKHNERFMDRSGLATSSRRCAQRLWDSNVNNIPTADISNLNLARILFGTENPPGTEYVSGSQDQIGMMLPGVNRLDYFGKYWPSHIESITAKANYGEICAWLQSVLWLIPMRRRSSNFDPTGVKNINEASVERLADASHKCWQALLAMDIIDLGASLTETLYAYKHMLPNTVPEDIEKICEEYTRVSYGCTVGGAGGGGLLMIISDKPVVNAFQIEINFRHCWEDDDEVQD